MHVSHILCCSAADVMGLFPLMGDPCSGELIDILVSVAPLFIVAAEGSSGVLYIEFLGIIPGSTAALSQKFKKEKMNRA